jgi:tetratricopeptide (TPR) repeat protein
MATTDTRFFQLSLSGTALGRLEEAEHFYLAGNLNEALAAAQQAWRESPQEPDVFRVLAYIHLARGEYEPAAQAAYQAVVIDGENPASYASLAQVYLSFQMLAKAEETLHTARQRFPRDAALLVLAADLLFRSHHDTQAVKAAQQALAINPRDGYAKALLGAYYLRSKRYDACAPLLRDVVDVYPQRWDYLRDLGIAQFHCGSMPDALQALSQSFRRNPSDTATQQYLFLALRWLRGRSFLTDATVYFYKRIQFCWVMNIIGVLLAIIAVAILLNQLSDGDSMGHGIDLTPYLIPTGLLVVGVALIWLTLPAARLSGRRGKKFEMGLWKTLRAQLPEKSGE